MFEFIQNIAITWAAIYAAIAIAAIIGAVLQVRKLGLRE